MSQSGGGGLTRAEMFSQRWMLFVDGENFAIRGAAVAKAKGVALPSSDRYFIPNVFVWLPEVPPVQALAQPIHARRLQDWAVRAHYYTSMVGSHDDVERVRGSIRQLGFHPEVFKRPRNQPKAKGVDITLTRDMLVHAFRDNYDVAVLIAGDADYVPVLAEVKRLGKTIYVAFFRGPEAGFSNALLEESDKTFDLTQPFCQRWRDYLAGQRAAEPNPATVPTQE